MSRADENDPAGTILFVLKLLTISVDEISSKDESRGLPDVEIAGIDGHLSFLHRDHDKLLRSISGSRKSAYSAGKTCSARRSRRAELEESICLLEAQAAQLQSSMDCHNSILDEILQRLPRVRQLGPWFPSKRAPGSAGLAAAASNSDSATPQPSGPKRWLDRDEVQVVSRERPQEYVGVLSSRIYTTVDQIDSKPLMTPRARITRARITKSLGRDRPRAPGPGSGPAPYNLQFPATVPKSSVNAGHSVDTSDAADPQSDEGYSEPTALSAPIIARDFARQQLFKEADPAAANGMTRSSPLAAGHAPGQQSAAATVGRDATPGEVAGQLWHELERAVRGKAPVPGPEPNSYPQVRCPPARPPPPART